MPLDQAKADKFAIALAKLCQRHGVWIWGPTEGSIILSTADPEIRCTYEVKQFDSPSHSFLLKRKLVFDD